MYPLLTINLSKLEHNTRVLAKRCQAGGIEIIGVTKCCLGAVPVASAMQAGGVKGIGDSRLPSLNKLAKAGIAPLMMLRQPMHFEVDEVVKNVDVSLVSELGTAILLSSAAGSIAKEHSILIMVEAGDLREGILPCEVMHFVEKIRDLPNLNIVGIGTNVACLEGASPSTQNLELLIELSKTIEKECCMQLSVISGGNSSALKLLECEGIPYGINQLRIGEGILLGQNALDYQPIEGLFQDAFVLSAEVIEVREKRANSGAMRRQAVLALGRQDIADGYLKPIIQGAEILKTSSDHLVLNVESCSERVKVGNFLSFIPSYFALLGAMTSPFVNREFCSELGRL